MPAFASPPSPKLRGKLHIFVGGADALHLEESVKLLCDFLVQKGSNASCEIIPDRRHFNLYEEHPSHPDGLFQRVLAETQQRASGVSVRGAP